MEGYKHILLAVDFTPGGETVGKRALDLAERYRARLSLLHVVENLPVDPANEFIAPPQVEVQAELMENAERKLREFAQALDLSEADRAVTTGSTKQEILAYAQEKNCDLIIVGSHGRHGLALLLGSTANALLHGARCDLLAVRI